MANLFVRSDPDDPNSPLTKIPYDNIFAVHPSFPGLSHSTVFYTKEIISADKQAKTSPFIPLSVETSDCPAQFIQKSSAPPPWLASAKTSKDPPEIHVIISVGSGTGLAEPSWKTLVRPALRNVGVEEDRYIVHTTTSESSITELAQNVILPKANRGVAQTIILLSGDGGIIDIVNVLVSGQRSSEYRKPIVCLLPLGTGNAMANSAMITRDNTLGLQTMLQRSPREIPLFQATFSSGARLLVNEGSEEQPLPKGIGGSPILYGAVVCSWGFHATLVADSDTSEYRKNGADRFKMAANELLHPSDGSRPHGYMGKVSFRRPENLHYETLPHLGHGYVLATFVSHLEKGFNISPSSTPLDGKLRLVQFGELDGEAVMDVMKKAYDGGKHVDDERVNYYLIESLRIDFEEDDARWRRVCVDGKIVRVEEDGWVEVKNLALSAAGGVLDLVAPEA